jgi:hypothetical protein
MIGVRRGAGVIRIITCAVFAMATAAQSPPAAAPAPAEPDLEPRVMAAIHARDWDTAETLLHQQVERAQGKFIPYYNLACVRSVRGDKPGAMEWLIKAIERGFCDVHQLRRDSYLSSLQGEDSYRHLEANWGTFLDKRVERDVIETRKVFGAKLGDVRDAKLRVVVMSGFDERATSQARAGIQEVARWSERSLFGPLMDVPEAALDPWVTIALPQRDAFVRWSLIEFGPGALTGSSAIGGLYGHDDKRLVSQDLGATLRHEFLHVLHWRHMSRLGQRHPIYIMEGLCSLAEDLDTVDDADAPTGKGVVVASSWRTNIVKRRERGGTFPSIDSIARMTHEQFVGSRPLANYAFARTLFQWMESQGKLRAWYEHYVAHFAEDSSGVRSMEAVLGAPSAELTKKWRAWVRLLPEVPEEIGLGMASLGVSVEGGGGDGVSVVGITPPRNSTRRIGPLHTPTHLKGESGEVRVGDCLRAVDGRPVRELAELVRVLGAFRPGDVVELEIRRGKKLESVRLRLVARE